MALKCNHCIDRVRRGELPACVDACKVQALEFGEINELVKRARTRFAAAVSLPVAQLPSEIAAIPAQIEGWRAWGEAVSRLNANGKKGA